MRSKKFLSLILITLASLALACLLFSENVSQKITENLENYTWDFRTKITARFNKPDDNIAIIMIDQTSLETLAEEENIYWPWPRELYVPIIEFLTKAGAKGLAIDVLFSEQSSYGVEDDQALAQSMQQASIQGSFPVVQALALRNSSKDLAPERAVLIREIQKNMISSSEDLFRNAQQFTSATSPNLEILKTTKLLGNVSSSNDQDGIFRHISPSAYLKDIPILTLPFSFYSALNKTFPENFKTTKSNQLAVRFTDPDNSYKTYRFVNVLKSFQDFSSGKTPLLNPDVFKDKYVFLGMNAPGLMDLRPTPISKSFAGVSYHATVLDNLLNNNFITKAKIWQNLLFVLLLSLLVASAALFIRKLSLVFLVVLLIFIASVSGAYFLAHFNFWLKLAVPIICGAFSLIAALGVQYQLEGSKFRFIKKAFRYYVSPEVIEKIIKDPNSLKLGGEKRELTMFFSDIAGFTGISENTEASSLVQLLNIFLSEMTKIILAHGGTVDKYVGDAVIAFWNAPIKNENHAALAVKAAIACQQRLFEIQSTFVKFTTTPIEVRIGLHTAEVNIGNFGSDQRFNYTMIGDGANLASRIEGVNKVFGTKVLFSEATKIKLLEEIPALEIATVRVVGREEAIKVYSPEVLLPEISQAAWQDFQRDFIGDNYTGALEKLASLPEIKLTRVYADKINTGDMQSIWEMRDK